MYTMIIYFVITATKLYFKLMWEEKAAKGFDLATGHASTTCMPLHGVFLGRTPIFHFLLLDSCYGFEIFLRSLQSCSVETPGSS